ncbi:GT2 family glycosyltransferase [Scopulibacillus daqui]|uniref:GT2 family glycosyltransferase n=1 Tax=Scopulibacillus daqui TaxID=1469162 RepID=A0ABS2PYM1_9BACL|nr:glycosyltransferase family 2 protein [Scopulibacillus daqui]MBM7645056.1 GT2 family glycosyltransferase [Scopulibacillus daqui]
MTSINIAVVILNWNNWQDTIKCIDDFKKQEKPVDIIVVDNASTDGSQSYLQDIDGITFLQNDRNDGYARGNNLGIYSAIKRNNDAVVVVNNDITIRSTSWSEDLQTSISRLPANWGYLGFKIVNADGSVFQDRPVNLPNLKDIFLSNTLIGCPLRPFRRQKPFAAHSHLIKSDIVSGACFALNSKAVKQIGAFDPFTFLYGEERILAKKYLDHHWQGYIDLSIEVEHAESSTTKHYPSIVYVNRLRSELYYIYKTRQYKAPICYLWILLRITDTLLRTFIKNVSLTTFKDTIKMYKNIFNDIQRFESDKEKLPSFNH